MHPTNFHDNWLFKHKDTSENAKPILLPHDAMLFEARNSKAKSGSNGAWFEGHCYEYTKQFFVPSEAKDEHWILEFEGIMQNAQVFLNHTLVAERPYGYSHFYASIDQALFYNAENTLLVIADNSSQPNSRWYTGAGIYRPVTLWRSPKAHIKMNGVKISTRSIMPPKLEISISTNAAGIVDVEILDHETVIWHRAKETDGKVMFAPTLPNAKLWSPDEPNLYHCRVTFGDDSWEDDFGIRLIDFGKDGLLINGKREILRGACIHHDNGLLGAATWADAEERRVRLLKENGYNAIRSAHNPCSKALLKACDRQGMFVLDELTDCWYIHKTKYDYASLFKKWWKKDLYSMITKDYNHPSVIMYSIGNEVSETAQKRGISLTQTMVDFIHRLDDSRPVTCGVNIFFNFLSSIGFGIYTDKKAMKETKAVGSQFFNQLAGLLGDTTMKLGATLPPCDWKTKEAFANMDIAGYNYGIFRYRHDLKKYPNRLILGTETFCRDVDDFWKMAQKHHRIIGDFVWAGMDYLGEVGIGAWEYHDYAPVSHPAPGWISAGSGRIDLTGKPLAEAAYTKVVYGLIDHPIIAVRPVNHTNDSHSPSAWKMTNAIESWSWDGYEASPATVEVYAKGHAVSLYLNGKKIGQKRLRKCRAIFHTFYHSGTITAVSYNKKGKKIASHTLHTAGSETILQIQPEQKHVKPGHLSFVRLAYTDAKGILKPLERHEISVKVDGGKLLALGHACPYNEKGYLTHQTETYFGEALAIILVENEQMTVSAYEKK